jgi:hypothetical protein
MRAEIGKIILDKTFSERQALNANIVNSIEKVAANWGISIERYEIKDVKTTFFFKSFRCTFLNRLKLPWNLKQKQKEKNVKK